MPKLPKANLQFNKLTETDLSDQTQAIIDGLFSVEGAAIFPAPPIEEEDMQDHLNSYNAALAAAVDGDKQSRAAKNAAKLQVMNDVRANQAYVNQIIYNLAATGVDYATLQSDVLITGYLLNKQPAPVGPLPAVAIKKYGSYTSGQFYILAIALPGAKGYVVRVLNQTTGAPPFDVSFSSTRMTILGLIPGNQYTFAIAAIGSNPTRNFATQLTDQWIV